MHAPVSNTRALAPLPTSALHVDDALKDLHARGFILELIAICELDIEILRHAHFAANIGAKFRRSPRKIAFEPALDTRELAAHRRADTHKMIDLKSAHQRLELGRIFA